MIFSASYSRLKLWRKKYEKWLMPGFLFLGFIVDYITLNRVDSFFDNAIITAYVLLTMLIVFASHFLAFSKKELSIRLKKIQLLLPFALQFAYGGLLSGITIFYYRSSSLLTLPFLLILLLLFIGNDYLHQKYPKLSFQILVLGIATSAYTIILTPVIVGHISWFIFLLGLSIGTIIMYGYISLFKKYIPTLYEEYHLRTKVILASIFLLFLFLYNSNILPPIPLSLKSAGVYASVIRTGADEYEFEEFDKPWYEFWKETPSSIETDGSIYVFASVFAPKNFSETLYHVWSHYNEDTRKWDQTDRITTNIIGGRAEGFRGFTKKTSLEDGKWRIDITNKKGQVIDRIGFKKK